MLLEKYIIELGSVKSTMNKGTEFKIKDGVLYILGSDDLGDWLINFRTFSWNNHEGFLAEAQIVGCKVRGEEIKLIVGHSAGAAVGGFLGYMLDVPVFAFGCPRYFNRRRMRELAEYSDNQVTYFDLKNDYVSMLPPWYSRGKKTYKAGKKRGFAHFLLDYQRYFGSFDLGKF